MNNDMNSKDDTKVRILKVALDLFSKHGFEGVSIRKIAEAASCNIASLNYYFGTKKKLYDECLLKTPDVYHQLDIVLKSPLNRKDFEDGFIGFCTVVSGLMVENESSIKLLVNELNANPSCNAEDSFFRPLNEKFEIFLGEAQRKGIVNQRINAALFTWMVVSAILSQKIYKSFKTFDNITDADFSKKIVESCTVDFYT